MQRIIQRPSYCGVFCEKWTNYRPLKAKWNGLVSIEIFNKANRGKVYIKPLGGNKLDILYNQNYQRIINKRNNFRQDYPFKNVILCDECKLPLHASASTGKSGRKFPSYHCSRNHKRISVPKKELEEKYQEYLSRIRFDDSFVSTLEKVVFQKYRQEEGDVADKSNFLSKKVIELKEQKQMKLRAIELTNSPIVKADLEREYEQLHLQIIEIQEQRNNLDLVEDEIHEFLRYARGLMEHPAEILAEAVNKQEQASLYSLFFDEFPTYSEILNGTPKLSLLFKLNSELRDEKSQVVTLQSLEWNSIESEIIRWREILYWCPSLMVKFSNTVKSA